MAPVVEVIDLKKVYGDLTAVDTVSYSVKQGSLFGLLGPNGSGKTTMVKMLTGQITPTDGLARVLDLNVGEQPVAVRERVGIIPEQESPPSFLTAAEYLDFIGEIRQMSDIHKESAWWFEFLEFGDKKDVLCKDLSRGTRQKLMFTQAFIHRPCLAFIDEPLVNFDPIMQRKVKDYLTEYVKRGNTIFLCTHLLEIAEEICSDFAILHKGHLLFHGTIPDLKKTGQNLGDFFLSLVRKDQDV